MKLLIASYGTDGDVRPLIALAQCWMESGQQVRLLADRSTLDDALRANVPCAPLAGDIRGDAASDADIASVVGPKRSGATRALAQIANRHAASWLRDILEAGRDADVILASGLAVFSALSAGERLGVPVAGASFIPLTPTRRFASPFLPPSKWPGLLNVASHRFVNNLIWRSMRKACNHARMRIAGLPSRTQPWTTHPVLYGISPTLLPSPMDWPRHVHLCGQWLRPTLDWSPPPALADFLDAGPAPLYVGFGSMKGFDRAVLWREIFSALKGRRAVVAPGWAGLEGIAIPKDAFVLGEVPHDALFPHMSAVVHHGGSGTSHSATRAGRPSVVVPFAGDQAFWGSRLNALGVAPPPLSGHHLSAAALARAIESVGRDDVRARAQALGERMQAEDGPRRAVQALQHLLAPPRQAAA
jgi:sterol 3beta-glucosyltransferase